MHSECVVVNHILNISLEKNITFLFHLKMLSCEVEIADILVVCSDT